MTTVLPVLSGAGIAMAGGALGSPASSTGSGSETTWMSPLPTARTINGTASAGTWHSHRRTPCSRACPSAWPSFHPVPSGMRSRDAVVVESSASTGSSITCLPPRSPHLATPASSRSRTASMR